MPKKIVVGLSGGVDSAVAAYLLKQQGHDVRAVFMKNFSEAVGGVPCPWREDRQAAFDVAAFLKIPIEMWNFEREYYRRVLDHMVAEYRRGRTPNPDIVCNNEIKFKVFLERALSRGYGSIATGHYARVRADRSGVYRLFRGRDRGKDQSYFLSGLTQRQLKRVAFPLGRMTKQEVRRLARRIGLPNADRKDSQGICFVGPVSMLAFLKTYIKPNPGDIVDTGGNILGRHQGIYYYTIGQRRGINVGGGPALYVVGKDRRRNRLIVGVARDRSLYRSRVLITGWRWTGERLSLPLSGRAQIRYRQPAQEVRLARRGRAVEARFARPQRAVAPGQTLVLYGRSEILGSGIIA